MVELLKKYEKTLDKHKRSSETRKAILESYKALPDFRRIEGDPDIDFERMITANLSLSKVYAKQGQMDKAYLRLKNAYEVLIPRISQIEEIVGTERVNKYLSAIEKRAKDYRKKMVESQSTHYCSFSKNITDIMTKCKQLKEENERIFKKVLARLKKK